MKHAFTSAIFALLLTLAPIDASEADGVLSSLQSINQSRYHRLESDALGRPLHVVVKLPSSWTKAGAGEYPAIYLLDGGAVFPMLAGYYNYLRHEELVPEAIIVALSYAADNFEGGNHRSTDYTAATTEREFWGGAGVFQSVLEQELLPLIESNYPADPKRRVLFGQSLGGQFVLYTALTKPGLFWGHIASNPALHRNLEFFLEPRSHSGPSGSRLFVASASGDAPRFREPAVTWIERWTRQSDLPWQLNAVTIEGYGHFSVVTESFRRGLLWLFD